MDYDEKRLKLQYFIFFHQLMKAAVRADSYNISSFFHRNPQTPMISTDSSQVGVALFPSN